MSLASSKPVCGIHIVPSQHKRIKSCLEKNNKIKITLCTKNMSQFKGEK